MLDDTTPRPELWTHRTAANVQGI